MIRLKEEYKGKKVTVRYNTALITFDTDITPETDYELLNTLGFDFCFEQEARKPLYKAPIEYKGIEIDNLQKATNKTNGKKAKVKAEKG